MALGEFELIRRYFQGDGGAGVNLGVGDDCALLSPPPNKVLATSVDTLVAGRHFPADADPALIGERALRVNLSDLAAMGAEPLWFTLALTLPEAEPAWLEAFSAGLRRVARQYRCSLVGGDTTSGPLAITVQVTGAVPEESALRRDRAAPGDAIYVTGSLGDAAAALGLIQGKLNVDGDTAADLRKRYFQPTPRVQEGRLLRGLASAAIDVSDGLLADLGHICEASGVGAAVALEQLPFSAALVAAGDLTTRERWALGGGDDYELCFTVAPERAARLEALITEGRIAARAIGEMTAERQLRCRRGGEPVEIETKGYQHFGQLDP